MADKTRAGGGTERMSLQIKVRLGILSVAMEGSMTG